MPCHVTQRKSSESAFPFYLLPLACSFLVCHSSAS
ncbi:hypothetical protein predicted by Glimmer/Critica [Salmonella enterica subsp. enterica serovar Weltevreden str. 2007-60-3289-1]|nr:hypothetical protein predicted by Glimmer/Critica [Salmonella enterica subsp. enterica serovar Weltevreden str. 2007-60-3289-1]